MISKQTVLILGAGASNPYGFPLGSALISDILHNLDISESHLVAFLIDKGIDQAIIVNFSADLRRSFTPSIDLFLQHRDEYNLIGKYSIAYSLIQHENPVDLYSRLESCEDNWYPHLWRSLITSFSDFCNNKLSIINFNYDRSLEYFLINSMTSFYGKEIEECAKELDKIKHIHIHGSLGKLPWQSGANTRGYIEAIDYPSLEKCKDSIFIIHEKDGNGSVFQEAKDAISEAEQIYFLGFAYHPESLARLDIRSAKCGRIVGTGFKLGNADRATVKYHSDQKIKIMDDHIQCLSFCRNYVFYN